MNRPWRAVFVFMLWPAAALAYRPFDETDADVVRPKEVEVELGTGALLQDPGRTSLSPGLVINFGVANRLEAVVEGDAGVGLGSISQGGDRWSIEPALLLKGILREGSLQDKSGPSIALEAGILLPEVPRLVGTGGSMALIGSERWEAASLHVNLMAERARDDTLDLMAGTIGEGPADWRVRPVGEIWIGRTAGTGSTSSLLAGAIWRALDQLALDGAVRAVSDSEQPRFEIRLGLTWALPV
jgi:hypothetical protein